MSVSRIGFGCYRVDDRSAIFAEALAQALTSGCTLIDTSTNYTDGGSERCVGQVTGALLSEGKIRRDQISVVSKIGYVQGQNLRLADKREREGRAFAEMVKYTDGCWHCIHPDFLADQLDRSLERLRLPFLDVCLLHNPEYFFSDAVHRGAGTGRENLRDEFYRRLQAAFAYFESEVARGRIRSYGISSNSCTAPEGDPEMTSLDRMLAAAVAAGGPQHHFTTLQLPLNLMESGAVFEPNNAGKTVLQAAAAANVAVLVNRPLNAIVKGHLMRFSGALEGKLAPAIDPLLPRERRSATLSQKVLHILVSTPGVSSVLLGMRQPAYVDDALPVLSWEPLPHETVRRIFEGFRA
jgi:aryl-alcohol dehydrogenase-like predicted oxidoreductase